MSDPPPDATIVGAGMAGMTAALRLLEAGFSVRIIEASAGVGGKFGATYAKGGYHDFAWHIFADWCLNFWDISRAIGLSKTEDFAECPTLTLLRPLGVESPWARAATLQYVGSPEFFWANLNSGAASWSDLLLFTYSLYALLCDQDLEREEFLNRVPVNGYMRALPFMSDVAALLHNELLLRVWAVPSYLISARSYQKYLQLIAPFTYPASPVVVLRKNFEEGFWAPFVRTLSAAGPRFALAPGMRVTGIRLSPAGDRVDSIVVAEPGAPPRVEPVRNLVLAVPPEALAAILGSEDSAALRWKCPDLLDVSKLHAQQTSALTLYFRRPLTIPGVGGEPVALIDHFRDMYRPGSLSQRNGLASRFGLSFLDVGRLWGVDADHPTVLSVLASDADALLPLGEEEACRHVVRELRRYLEFEDADIDWSRSHFQGHRGMRLFVNTVGSWEYRPEVRVVNSEGQSLPDQVWRAVHNLYLAGDYCRSQIDIVSLEGAIHTGTWAAHVLSAREVARGRSGVRPAEPPRSPRPWDRRQAEETRDRLEKWAGLARSRSRRTAAALARMDEANDRQPPPGVASSPARGATPGGRAMSEALSTSPGFAEPMPAEQSNWLARHRDTASVIKLRSGASVAVPMFYWEARALVLNGVADADAVGGLPSFRDRGLRVAHVDPETLNPSPGSGRAVVAIWAPDYGGTTVGPIKAVFASVAVEKRATCPESHQGLGHVWWWWYYGNSPVNQEFKRDVWGIVPNELAQIETTYDRALKGVRLLEHGRVALRLRLDTGDPQRVGSWHVLKIDPPGRAAGGPRAEARTEADVLARLAAQGGQPGRAPGGPRAGAAPVPASEPLSFVTVAHRGGDDGENEVELFGGKTWGVKADMEGGKVPYDAARDVFYLGADTALKKRLEAVDFQPVAWDYFTGYNGVVKIYDDKGRAQPKVIPDERTVEAIVRGLSAYDEARRRLGQAP